MTKRSAGIDYQALAVEFEPGNVVVPYGANRDYAGRVVTVWPAIGMVDVNFPAGTKRYPVEDLLRLDDNGNPNPPETEYVPGGAGTVPVSGGPFAPDTETLDRFAKRLASLEKEALYWAARDRRYRATNTEIESKTYLCPRCDSSVLRKAIYRRNEGKSEHLLGCPSCMFLIAPDSIMGVGC